MFSESSSTAPPLGSISWPLRWSINGLRLCRSHSTRVGKAAGESQTSLNFPWDSYQLHTRPCCFWSNKCRTTPSRQTNIASPPPLLMHTKRATTDSCSTTFILCFGLHTNRLCKWHEGPFENSWTLVYTRRLMHFPDYKCLKVDLWLLVSEITVRQNILANDLKWVKQEIVAKKILKRISMYNWETIRFCVTVCIPEAQWPRKLESTPKDTKSLLIKLSNTLAFTGN